MPKSYRVGEIEYQFPDDYTDEQAQSILTKQGVIGITRPYDSAKRGIRLNDKKSSPFQQTPAGVPVDGLGDYMMGQTSAGIRHLATAAAPAAALELTPAIVNAPGAALKSLVKGGIVQQGIERAGRASGHSGAGDLFGDVFGAIAAGGVGSSIDAALNAAGSDTRVAPVLNAITQELKTRLTPKMFRGLVDAVRQRVSPAPMAALATQSKALALSELKSAVKRGAVTPDQYADALVSQGHSPENARVMVDNVRAEMAATRKPPASAPPPMSKLSEGPRPPSRPISMDELKSAVKRKAMTIDEYKGELLKQGYPESYASLMADNLQSGIAKPKAMAATPPAQPPADQGTKYIQHLKDRGPLPASVQSEQLARYLKSNGVAANDALSESDWRIAAASAGLPEPTPEIIQAARGQLAWRPSPKGRLRPPQ